MKTILLARVSDKKQDSNDAQILRITDYINSHGLTVSDTYEIEESSTKGDRAKFQKIVEVIQQSKEPITLVVDTVDRLQRSFKESVQLDELRKAGKLEIHFYREGLVIKQTSNSADLLRWDMGVMFARSYVLQLSDNVKRKQDQLLRSGIYPSRPPYGYKRIPISKDKTEIVIDDYAAKIVKKLYEWYSTKTFSLELIRTKLASKEYGIKWSKGYVDKVLKDEFYCGVMTWKRGTKNEQKYPHTYPKIISRELFDLVQAIKAGFHKKPAKFAGKPYTYRGLMRCATCGCSITPEMHKGILYYHCTQYHGKHGAKWLTEANITKQIGSIFEKMKLPDNILQQIIGVLKANHRGKTEFRDLQYKELTKEHEVYAKRLEGIYTDKLDGRITVSEYDNFSKTFRDNIADIDSQLAALQDADDNYYLTAQYLVELAQQAHELFTSSELEEKRQLITLALSNLRVEDEFVRYDVIKPFDTILNYADRTDLLPR